MDRKEVLTMKMDAYVDYAVEQLKALTAIPSPSGFARQAGKYVFEELTRLGYQPKITQKGGVLVDLGGPDDSEGLLLMSHVDTLGAVVASIKENGRLKLSPLGGLQPDNTNTENCTIYTRFDGSYSGTFQLCDASVHVNDDYATQKRDFSHMELVLDEDVKEPEQVLALGILPGDVVCFDPRTVVTASGYIKSRFLDDKLSVAIVLALAKYLREEKVVPARKVYAHVTVYEEIGHGGCGTVPDGVTQLLAVDMGCVGEGLTCTERQVSICAKSSAGPSDYEMTTDLIRAAKAAGADWAVDVYPHYGSDADAALRAGWDVRHGLIGPGVYASHGYERSHVDGVKNTLLLLAEYLGVTTA